MNIRDHIAGFAFVLSIAGISYYLSAAQPSVDALAVSLVVGMLAGNLTGHEDLLKKGWEAALRVFLPVGVALYGVQMSFGGLAPGPLQPVLLVMCGLFGLTILLSIIFNVKTKIGLLIASGLAISGPAAIAVMSPLIGAKKEETSISVISIATLGLAGMIFLPIIYDLFALSHEEFSFLAGTTLPVIGQVKVAAARACPECLSSAQRIKLIRTPFLVLPVLASIFHAVRDKGKSGIPLYAVAFICISIALNVVRAPGTAIEFLKGADCLCLSAAFAAIGLLVDFDSVVEEGVAPLAVVFGSSCVVILVTFLFRNLF